MPWGHIVDHFTCAVQPGTGMFTFTCVCAEISSYIRYDTKAFLDTVHFVGFRSNWCWCTHWFVQAKTPGWNPRWWGTWREPGPTYPLFPSHSNGRKTSPFLYVNFSDVMWSDATLSDVTSKNPVVKAAYPQINDCWLQCTVEKVYPWVM